MGIINPHFTLPGQDRPPLEFLTLQTQQGQINWLASFLMSVNTVFDNVTGSITEIEAGADPRVEVTFDPDTSTADFSFFLPPGPQGETGPQGEQGPQGENGAAAGFGSVTATVDNAVGTPSVTVTASGPDTAKEFAFAFHNLKGETGAPGDVQADGVYPELGAGTADALYSTDEVTDTFAQRVSDHDGACRITSLYGNTVRWNQIYPTNIQNRTASGVTFTDNGDGSYTVNGTATSDFVSNSVDNVETVEGHKYAIIGNIGSSVYANVYQTGLGGNNAPAIFTSLGTSCIARVYVPNGTTVDNVVIKPMLFDLTAMFGAGNEPATVAEFEHMFSEDYYPYDAGSLLSVNIEGIESAGVMREIPVATYFPDGMRSAGSAYDELTSDKAVTRIGTVDLGELTWVYESNDAYFYAPISDKALGAFNIICAEYETSKRAGAANLIDGRIVGANSGNSVYIKDASYTDAATFKSAMSGVILNYELATPTEAAIDPPLNMSYRVEAGGTESIVIPTGEQSAPPRMAVLYGYTADGLRDEALAVIAPIENGNASTNYAIGSYLVHNGKLCKVTVAIASGEAVEPGTNCTVTTVMAEMVTLTS